MIHLYQLSELNSKIASALSTVFAPEIQPVQNEFGHLLFRGPVTGIDGSIHTGTHVIVAIDQDVLEVLDAAELARRGEMVERLVLSLGTQVRVKYNKEQIGQYALRIVGDRAIIQDYI